VQFSVIDGVGNVVIAPQTIGMQREYSYDATNTIGNASEVTEIQNSLNQDMVQAILFRLQAAGKHPLATPAASPAAAPAAASSAH
jgi:LPS-assembly lipoprotein